LSINKPIPILNLESLDNFHFGNFDEPPFRLGQPRVFHINRLEDYRNKLRFPLPPHRKAFFDLIFITQGTSTRSKGLNQYTFGANDFFFLPAYQITEHQSMSEDCKGYFLQFDAQLFQNFGLHRCLDDFSFLDFLAQPIVPISPEAQQPILNIFERIETIYNSNKTDDFQTISFYILALMSEVKRYVVQEKSATKNAASSLTQQFKNALSQHIYQKQKVSEYADLLYVTSNHLNKCVKATTDKTAQDLLKEMLILEAKSLLRYSALTISQIAVQLCNEDPSNFARFFKNQTGLSPKEYQQQG
jgi:AraC family transcriptional regulator, transcriptional activator of pobA